MMESELTCRELVELVTDYFEDALDAHVRARFEEHLAACAHCRAYLGQLRATLRLVRDTGELESRPEVAGLRAALRGFTR